MPDVSSLRTLATQVQPPALDVLEEVAQARARRTAVVTALSAVVCAGAVAVGLVLLLDQPDRSLPEPAPTPSVTITTSPTASPAAAATHRSDTSMTPHEVVAAGNADLLLSGVSADDPDFRLAIWTAACTWCPNDDEPRGRPRFYAMAVTTDGFATATYLRPPWEPSGLEHVESPGPGLLLVIDAANGPEWLVRDDGTVTPLARVVEPRRPVHRRYWHTCLDAEDFGQVSWCALDPTANASYVWQSPWRGSMNSSESIVSPGASDEPWGLVWLRPDYYHPAAPELVAYWYDGGVRHTKDFGHAGNSGEVWNLPRDVMSVWAFHAETGTLTLWSSADQGASWQSSRLEAPWGPRDATDSGFHTRRLTISSTPGGGLVALQEASADHSGAFRLWRAGSADGGGFVEVFASDTPVDAPGADVRRFTVVDGRIWLGGLWSGDDGRTWNAVPAWR